MTNKINDKIRGCIWGALIGNSFGACVSGLYHKDLVASFGLNKLKYLTAALNSSNYPLHEYGNLLADSYMALENAKLVIDNVNSSNELLKENYRKKVLSLLSDSTFLDSSPNYQLLQAMRSIENADGYCVVGEDRIHSSGSLQNIFLGLLPNNKFNLIELSKILTSICFPEDQVQAASAVIVDSINYFMTNDLPDRLSVENYVNSQMSLATSISSRFADSWWDVAPDLDYDKQASVLPYSVVNIYPSVNELVPSSVAIFLIFRESFEDVVTNAVLAGGMTQMSAMLAGCLAGVYKGYSAIPKTWLEKFTHVDEIEKIIAKIVDLWN